MVLLPGGVEQLLPERRVVGGEAVQAEGAEDQLGDEGVGTGVGEASGDVGLEFAEASGFDEEVDGQRCPHTCRNC